MSSKERSGQKDQISHSFLEREKQSGRSSPAAKLIEENSNSCCSLPAVSNAEKSVHMLLKENAEVILPKNKFQLSARSAWFPKALHSHTGNGNGMGAAAGSRLGQHKTFLNCPEKPTLSDNTGNCSFLRSSELVVSQKLVTVQRL